MRQYSFIEEQYFLEEGRFKSSLVALLAALGIYGSSAVRMPQNYIRMHPRERTLLLALAERMKQVDLKGTVKKIADETGKTMKETSKTLNPEFANTKDVGVKLLRSIKTLPDQTAGEALVNGFTNGVKIVRK